MLSAISVDGRVAGGEAPLAGLLERLASEGYVGACDAEIRGGWNRGGGDEGHFGVVLFLIILVFSLIQLRLSRS